MNSKSLILVLLALICQFPNLIAQVSGNVVYSEDKLTEEIPFAEFQKDNSVLVEVSAIYNAIADDYVALFSVSQLGESAAITNSMMDSRLNGVKQEFVDLGVKESDIYFDMITFVPEYEYEVQKKLFSKSYNEIPKGFRLQKNIHVRYKKSKMLDKLMAACAKYEIYDLIKVEYFSANNNVYYDTLRIAAMNLLKSKIKDYKEFGVGTDKASVQISENTFVKFPQEQYSKYQAFNSSSIETLKKSSALTQVNKTTSYYYNQISYKGYDIVINPVITEPVIQYAVTMKIKLTMKIPPDEKNAEYYILTPNGDLKSILKK